MPSPKTGDDLGSVTEDANVTNGQLVTNGTLSITDIEPDQAAFKPSTITNDLGTLKISADGKWDYAVNNQLDAVQQLKEGETKNVSFQVESIDGTKHNIIITINGANETPDAVDDTINITSADSKQANEPFFINVLENDTDPDGDPITISSATLTNAVIRNAMGTTIDIDLATLGSVTIENNQVKLVSNINSNVLGNGETAFINVEYTISDIHGATDTALLTLVITDKDDQAILQNDSTTTDQNTSITTNVLANDTDIDRDTTLVLDENIEVINIFNQNNESLRSQGVLTIQDNQIVLTDALGHVTKNFGLL